MKLQITLILGTTRINNESQKVARFLLDLLANDQDVQVHFLDLGQVDVPIMEERLHLLEDKPADLVHWNQQIQDSHGILIVAPEYKGGYPGSLKNFFDYLPRGPFRYKPVGLATVSSGVIGGVSCLSQLRLATIALAGLPIPEYLRVPNVKETFPHLGADPGEAFRERTNGFLSEFLKYTKVCQALK